MQLYDLALDVLSNPRHSRWVSNCLLAGEGALCALIIWKVSYTEIDWTTYMQQVSLFLEGENNYALIKGDTGPLVYPALHVYIYSGLYYLTQSGTNIFTAQCIFALLYLVTLAVVFACYRKVGAPPWLLAPLVLSKRLHSIFLLRLFNDAWAALALWLAIWALQKKWWAAGGIIWCLGLGIKMTLLLAVPAVAAIILQGAGGSEGLLVGLFLPQIQLGIAAPFYAEGNGLVYFRSAFDLGRQFLFKWTVNWRWVGEEVFISPSFANSLLASHASVVILFLQTRWIQPASSNLLDFARKYTRPMSDKMEETISHRVTPTFVMDSMLGSMVIGMLFARSLHYQFYAYLGWATPFLLWRSGFGPIWVLLNCTLQELAWLTYPSTNASSGVVVAELILMTASVWFGSQNGGKLNTLDSKKVSPKEDSA